MVEGCNDRCTNFENFFSRLAEPNDIVQDASRSVKMKVVQKQDTLKLTDVVNSGLC